MPQLRLPSSVLFSLPPIFNPQPNDQYHQSQIGIRKSEIPKPLSLVGISLDFTIVL